MKNIAEREQIEKWSQQWQQIKQSMILALQIERAQKIMQAKVVLPFVEQSKKRKFEDHVGLIEDEQKCIEVVANEKGRDTENQACVHLGESVLGKQGLFHQGGSGRCEHDNAEEDVEKIETRHAAMSLVVQHELVALKSGLDVALDTIGLVPPWVDTQRDSGQYLTDDKLLVPQALRLLDHFLFMKADDYVDFKEEGHLYGCVSPLSQVLFSHRTSVDEMKKSAYHNTLEEYVEVLTERLLEKRELFIFELEVYELESTKVWAAAKIRDAIRYQLGEMACGKSIAEIDAKMTEKVKAFAIQVSRDNFFIPSLSTAKLADPLKTEESVSKCIATYHQEKRAERYLSDYYALAFCQVDTMTDEEVSELFQRIISINEKARLLMSVVSVPMIRRVYSMSCVSSDYKLMIDKLMIDACSRSDVKVIKRMIYAEVAVNVTDSRGQTALMIAYQRGDQAVVSMLIKAGADVNAGCADGRTALMHACQRGDEAMVSMLIEAGANVNARDVVDSTALMKACAGGYEEVVSQLIEAGADVGASRCVSRHTALMTACERGNEAIVSMLLNAGADVNAIDDRGWTALMMARRLPIMQLLIVANADVNAVNCDGTTALMTACERGNEAIVSMLLNAGADVNAIDDSGWTALMMARRLPIMQLLIAANADVNAVNCDGGTVLILACNIWRCESIVSQLIEAGADANARNNDGTTALMTACERGNEAIVSMLLNAGADVNAIDDRGCTVLMTACQRGHKEVVSKLIDAGVDIDARNDCGQNAFDIAKAWCRNSEIASMVENAIIIADKTAGSAFSP